MINYLWSDKNNFQEIICIGSFTMMIMISISFETDLTSQEGSTRGHVFRGHSLNSVSIEQSIWVQIKQVGVGVLRLSYRASGCLNLNI